MAIEEAKDLNLIKLDELIRSLMTHKINLIGDEEVIKRKKNLTFKSNETDDKSINEEDITKLVSKKCEKDMKKCLKREFSTRNKEFTTLEEEYAVMMMIEENQVRSISNAVSVMI
ncbi:hypothetical protein SLEP1_g39437 [Rubroshorea leprosula]|uniref:Uncharacterized protein n=1 Tax=Rubroshorea leprosula TaxID=152421 RepID=A0AAV5L0L5_9ROSI|nr:hypothetical protein SLEP1_g39437 [Rubroshorea leprosula]